MSTQPSTFQPIVSTALAREASRQDYLSIRHFTESLCDPLHAEDMVAQSMTDASPVRWHLAHTTWFFETFILKPFNPQYRVLNTDFEYLFNSYYNTIGNQFARHQRGLLTRPTVSEVFQYREHVDQAIIELIDRQDDRQWLEIAETFQIGLQHEQQHQELILTDVKHLLSLNPLAPSYTQESVCKTLRTDSIPHQYVAFDEQLTSIGHDGESFAFDNESPRHQVLIHGFELGNRSVTNREFLEFVEDGGYQTPEFWLAAGWTTVQSQQWTAPIYWSCIDGSWQEFTLFGNQPLAPAAPAMHLSYFEADAYARWSGCRLPTEAEWEVAEPSAICEGNFVDSMMLRPSIAVDHGLSQMLGDCWEWTSSPYTGYPGYGPPAGAIGEYNGKFMCNQYVLRGGSIGTSRSHIRPTYRNFFSPEARWQFSGLRLARDA